MKYQIVKVTKNNGEVHYEAYKDLRRWTKTPIYKKTNNGFDIVYNYKFKTREESLEVIDLDFGIQIKSQIIEIIIK